MNNFEKNVDVKLFVSSITLSALLTVACVVDGELEADSLVEAATGDLSSSGSEESGDDAGEAQQGAEPASSDLKLQVTTEGACGPNQKEYFVVRAGLGGQAFAIDVDYNAYAWGVNDKGQLGIGAASSPKTKPVKVSGTQKFLAVAGGDKHTLGLAQDGTVWGWGDNSHGQIANPTTAIPKKIAGLSNVVRIAAGANFSLALTAQGQLYAWGDNTYGQIALGYLTGKQLTPKLVAGLSGVSEISAGKEFAMVLKGDRLWTWGRDDMGQLGNGSSTVSKSVPGLVPLTRVYKFAVGSTHAFALTAHPTDGDGYYAWGNNDWGQLGTGDLVKRVSPTAVAEASFLGVYELYAGETATFVGGASGFGPPKPGLEVFSTGRNDHHQLLHKKPNPVKQLSEMQDVLLEGWSDGVHHGYLQQIAAGSGYTLMLIGTTVKAIGLNSVGQLGDGTTVSRSTPTNVCLP